MYEIVGADAAYYPNLRPKLGLLKLRVLMLNLAFASCAARRKLALGV